MALLPRRSLEELRLPPYSRGKGGVPVTAKTVLGALVSACKAGVRLPVDRMLVDFHLDAGELEGGEGVKGWWCNRISVTATEETLRRRLDSPSSLLTIAPDPEWVSSAAIVSALAKCIRILLDGQSTIVFYEATRGTLLRELGMKAKVGAFWHCGWMVYVPGCQPPFLMLLPVLDPRYRCPGGSPGGD